MTRLSLAAVVVLAALLVWIRPRGEAQLAHAVARIACGDHVIVVRAIGSLEPETEQLVVAPREIGQTQIEEIVEDGSPVKKGQSLARLSTFRLDDTDRKARLQLRNKQAEWRRTLRDGMITSAEETQKTSNQAADLSRNRTILDYLEGGPDPRVVQSLKLKIDKAKNDEGYLARRLEAQEALKNRGFLSDLDYESIRSDQVKAQLDRTKQENTLAMQREGPRAEERQKARTLVVKFERDLALARKQALSQGVIRNLTQAKKQAEIADRQAAVDDVLRRRGKAVLKAPIDGVVVYSNQWFGQPIQVGSFAYGGRELMKVVQNGIMRAKVQVNERFVERVKVGMPAYVTVTGFDQEFPGKVHSIGKLAVPRDPQDPQSPRDFAVTIALAGAHPLLRPNATCAARIETARLPGVARIPIDAVRKKEGARVELVRLEGNAARREWHARVDEDSDFVYVRGVASSARFLLVDP